MKALGKQRKEYIFEQIPALDRKWQYLMGRRLRGSDMTFRQYELLHQIHHFFSYPPTIKELSERMETSHQNIKQLISVLNKRNYVSMIKDSHDGRMIRIEITEEGEETLRTNARRFGKVLYDIFLDFDEEEVGKIFDLLIRIENKTDKLIEKSR